MPFHVANETNYELPPAGLQPAVCVDVVDLGFQSTQFGDKHKVRFVFQIEETNSKGYRHTVSAWFNLSMHEKAGMRKFLENWRGQPFGEAELKPPGFDLESVVGKPCTVNIVHADSNGKTYANIGSIGPHSSKLGAALTPERYVRVEEREEAATAGVSGGTGQRVSKGTAVTIDRSKANFEEEAEDDGIPF